MKQLVFVIQKHDTVRRHFDFRLEINGGMPSWAIPKGPTLDNTKKRLAMETSVHDLSYQDFEGVLPEGEYGAGPVMVWDTGYYCAQQIKDQKAKSKSDLLTICDRDEANKIMEEGWKKGEIKFFLHGKKLKGSFALVRTRVFGKNAWLLIKHKDEYVTEGYDANTFTKSAKSGKTMEQIAASEK